MPFTTTLPQIHARADRHGVIAGFGTYRISYEDKCRDCGKAGIVYFPERVSGCMHCRNLNLSDSIISFEDSLVFHEMLGVVVNELPKIHALVKKRITSV